MLRTFLQPFTIPRLQVRWALNTLGPVIHPRRFLVNFGMSSKSPFRKACFDFARKDVSCVPMFLLLKPRF